MERVRNSISPALQYSNTPVVRDEGRMRRRSRELRIGEVLIGGENPVAVESMTKTRTEDATSTLGQLRSLAVAGCDIVRIAVPNTQAARGFEEIVRQSPLPVVADVHFHPTLALSALEAGAAGVRVNPGNMPERAFPDIVASAARHGAHVRVGVNSGSLPQWALDAAGGDLAGAMVAAARQTVRTLQDLGLERLTVSMKSPNVLPTLEACRRFASTSNIPLNLGITEAGLPWRGTVRSAVGMGLMLSEGLGDTLRVSLTSDPVLEVEVALEILRALDLRKDGFRVVSCPTCGRCEVDVARMAELVQDRLGSLDAALTVAVMGCVVNGPGEARTADVGIAGSRSGGVVFRRGEVVARVAERDLLPRLLEEIDSMSEQESAGDL
jgi:(E)-4-hydroxy-3-methylbut-2-enyl-diphosphate synthase